MHLGVCFACLRGAGGQSRAAECDICRTACDGGVGIDGGTESHALAFADTMMTDTIDTIGRLVIDCAYRILTDCCWLYIVHVST